MKNFSLRRITKRFSGFTLVELLVVIGIIAILAAVVMSAAGTAINMAKKAKAQNTATQLQTATLGYYTEYSVYPTPGTTATDWKIDDTDTGSAGSATWEALTECLSGMIQPWNGQPATETVFTNTRQIAFLSLKATDVGNGTTGIKDAPLNPLPYNTGHPYFNISVDGDYSGVIGGANETISSTFLPSFTTSFSGTGSATMNGTSTAGVAVWANCNPNANVNSSSWYVHTY